MCGSAVEWTCEQFGCDEGTPEDSFRKAFWGHFAQNMFLDAYTGFVLYSWWQLPAEQEDMYEVDLLLPKKIIHVFSKMQKCLIRHFLLYCGRA